MNAAIRELRRPRSYLVAAMVGVGAGAAGLPWLVAVAIAVIALLAGAGIAVWSDSREPSTAAPTLHTKRRQAVRPPGPSSEPIEATFRREGEYWTIAYGDLTLRLHDAKGLGYIHRLVASPGVEVHVLDMVVPVGPAVPTTVHRKAAREELPSHTSAREPLLDRQAREAYRRRIEDLRDEIEEADAHADHERASRARDELNFIADELHRQVRGDGASRTVPDATERARVNVSRAIRASIAKIAEHDVSLAHHLDRDIHTGTYCSYVPDPAATPSWRL